MEDGKDIAEILRKDLEGDPELLQQILRNLEPEQAAQPDGQPDPEGEAPEAAAPEQAAPEKKVYVKHKRWNRVNHDPVEDTRTLKRWNRTNHNPNFK